MPGTIQNALQRALASQPDGVFVFLESNGTARTCRFAEVWETALRMLCGLQARGCRAGEPIIIDAGEPIDFIPALWAVLLGGMVAVPIAYSHWNIRGQREFNRRLAKLAERLGQPLVMTCDNPSFDKADYRCASFSALAHKPPAGRIEATSRESPAVLISTSGTTGQPQLVTLSGIALMHRWWPAGPDQANSVRFLNWMSLDHVMGLGFASPNSLVKVQMKAESFVLAPLRWFAIAQQYRITHAGMSNFGMRLLVDPDLERRWDLSSLQRVGVGTEMVSRALCKRFIDRLVCQGATEEVVFLGYGLSECGPVAGGQRPFRPLASETESMSALIDVPTRGHAIRIVDGQGKLIPERQTGLIEVQGPTMTTGYHGDIDASKSLFTPDGWLRTGDLGYLEDGYLRVTGRQKEVLVVNAVKYSCAEIDASLQALNGISQAYVFSLPASADQGERVALVYVPDIGPGQTANIAAIESAIRKACADQYGFGLMHCLAVDAAQIPRTRTGKLVRAQLPELLARPVETVKPHSGDGRLDEMQGRIAGIMAQFIEGTRPDIDDDFFELGGDSLGALMFTSALEREFNVSLPPAVFTQTPTIRGILDYLHRRPVGKGRLSLVPIQHGDSGISLFVAPGVWGNAGYAGQLAHDLGPMFSVWTLHIADPGNRALQMNSIAEFAEDCRTLLRTVQPQGPYHLAGHSFGGLLAFEMAAQFLAAGEEVATLSIIDTLAKLEQRDFGVTDAKQADFLIDHHRYLTRLYLPPLIQGAVRYFRAADSVYLNRSDRTGGWGYFAAKGVEVIDVPGDHQSIVRGQSLSMVARHITEGLCQNGNFNLSPHQYAPEAARLAIHQAFSAAMAGDLRREIGSLRQAIAEDSGAPYWLYMRLGRAWLAAGKTRNAVDSYLAAVREDPYPLTSHFRFRDLLSRYKNHPIAKAALGLSRETVVDCPSAARMRGVLCAMLGDEGEAERSYRIGLDIVPESVELRLLLIDFLRMTGRQEEAVEQFEKALSFPIQNDVIYKTLGQRALRLGRLDFAEHCLQRAVSIDPGNLGALRLLVGIYSRREEQPRCAEIEARLIQTLARKKFRD
nr:AMP-binding protein [Allochromatium palmeri]